MSGIGKVTKTWRIHQKGHLLGECKLISPWTGRIADAVVDIDGQQVIAIHGASCEPYAPDVPIMVQRDKESDE